jgi:hypothetical protein
VLDTFIPNEKPLIASPLARKKSLSPTGLRIETIFPQEHDLVDSPVDTSPYETFATSERSRKRRSNGALVTNNNDDIPDSPESSYFSAKSSMSIDDLTESLAKTQIDDDVGSFAMMSPNPEEEEEKYIKEPSTKKKRISFDLPNSKPMEYPTKIVIPPRRSSMPLQSPTSMSPSLLKEPKRKTLTSYARRPPRSPVDER